MKWYWQQRFSKSGFTLVELLVVVGIILIMTSVIMVSISTVRQKSRDDKRIADAAQIRLAIELYAQQNREYPDYTSNTKIEPDSALYDDLDDFLAANVVDPLGGSSYSYQYNSQFDCGGQIAPAVMVMNLERDQRGNFEDLCGVAGNSDPEYIIVVQ